MATEINKIVLKRGTTAKALAYTGPVGEVVVDTDLRSLRVQDNVTPGGVLLSKDGHQHAIGDMTGLQAALDAKAPLASPTLTGVPLAPTAAAGTNTTQIATTAFVAAALASGVSGNAATASKLQTARTISLVGDVTGSVSFDGSTNVSLTATVDNDSHQHTFSNLLGLPTTLLGYGITDAQPLDADLTAIAALAVPGLVARTGNGTAAARTLSASGTGITVTNGDGAAGNPTVVSNATNANTAGTIVARDASGNFSAGTISAALSGNASTATALQTARTISLSGDSTGSVSFDGTTNAQINVTLANSGVGAGTYRSVTVDAKGRVTAGTNPTTLSGYGITDAQPLDADLTAIAALAGTTGFLKKTAADTWTLDTSTYITGNQNITVSGDATGSGSTAISLTLANSGVAAGTYNNSATAITPITVDAKGRVTGTGAAVTITPAWGSITGKPTTLAGYGITDAVSNSGTVPLANGDIGSASLTTSTTTAGQVVDSFAAATYRTAKYLVQATSGAAYQAVEVLVIHDGTNAYMTEYGNIATGASLVTLDADISGGNVRLLVTPVNAATTVRAVRTSIDV